MARQLTKSLAAFTVLALVGSGVAAARAANRELMTRLNTTR